MNNKSNRISEPTFLSNTNLFYRLALLEERKRLVSAHYVGNDKNNLQEKNDVKYVFSSKRGR